MDSLRNFNDNNEFDIGFEDRFTSCVENSVCKSDFD